MKRLITILFICVFLFSGVAYADLIAYYPFSGNAGDATGNGYNGTPDGATLHQDRFGNPDNAYSFDGSDDFITAGDVLDDVFAGPDKQFTITAWISPDELFLSPAAGAIVAKYADSNLSEKIFQ